MGFELPENELVIAFDETSKWAGAEVRCAMTVPLAIALRLKNAGAGDDQDERNLRLFAANFLTGWNFTRKGRDVPCTVDEFMNLDAGLAGLILSRWSEAVFGEQTQAPLEIASSDSTQPVVELTPTAVW